MIYGMKISPFRTSCCCCCCYWWWTQNSIQ